MNEEEMFEQLNYLIRDRNSFIGSDEELNVIYRKDIEALKQVMNGYKEFKLELSGYRNAILNNKEMLGLKEENQQLKEVIDKAIEFTNKYESIKAYYEYIDEDGYDEYNYDEDFKKELLDILKEVSK